MQLNLYEETIRRGAFIKFDYNMSLGMPLFSSTV